MIAMSTDEIIEVLTKINKLMLLEEVKEEKQIEEEVNADEDCS